MSTNAVSSKDIKRNWVLIDAKDQVLGRLAVEIAKVLRGKEKSNFVPYLDMGSFVVVTNVSQMKVTGKKEQQKLYYRHSGFPGGLKTENMATLKKRKPMEVLRHAVVGMIPRNRLGDKIITKLYLFPGEHNMDKQLGIKKETASVEPTREEAVVASA